MSGEHQSSQAHPTPKRSCRHGVVAITTTTTNNNNTPPVPPPPPPLVCQQAAPPRVLHHPSLSQTCCGATATITVTRRIVSDSCRPVHHHYHHHCDTPPCYVMPAGRSTTTITTTVTRRIVSDSCRPVHHHHCDTPPCYVMPAGRSTTTITTTVTPPTYQMVSSGFTLLRHRSHLPGPNRRARTQPFHAGRSTTELPTSSSTQVPGGLDAGSTPQVRGQSTSWMLCAACQEARLPRACCITRLLVCYLCCSRQGVAGDFTGWDWHLMQACWEPHHSAHQRRLPLAMCRWTC
jgi:hypothetical protein